MSWGQPDESQMKKYFTFEVTVLDDKNVHRRFRASNYQVRLASTRSNAVAHVRAVNHACEAIHLHYAHETGRGMEPDSVQLVGFHTPCLRHELH